MLSPALTVDEALAASEVKEVQEGGDEQAALPIPPAKKGKSKNV